MAESKIRIAQVDDDGNVVVNDTVQGVSVRERQNSTKILSISADDHVILKDVKDRLEEYIDSVIASEDKKKSYAELTKLSKDFAGLKDSLHGGSDEPNESMAQTLLARLHDAVAIAMTSRALKEVGQQRLKEMFKDLSDEVLHIRPGSLLIRLQFLYSTQFTKFLKTILSKDFLLSVTKDITAMLLHDFDKYLKVECRDPGYASRLLVLLKSYVKDVVVLELSYDATAAVKTYTDLYRPPQHFDFTVAFKCRLTMEQMEQSKAEQKRRQLQVIGEAKRIPELADLYRSNFIDRVHRSEQLSQLAKKCREETETCVEELAEQIDSLDRKCEGARNELEKIEVNCSYLRSKASALVARQIDSIKEENNRIADEIDEFEQLSKILEQNYIEDISGTVEQLKWMKDDLERILKLSTESQIVQRCTLKVAGARRILQHTDGDLTLTRKQISFVSGHHFKLQLKSLPSSLNYVTTYVAKTKSTKKLDVHPQINHLMEIERRTEYDIDHLSVNFFSSMSLMCGTSGGIRILDAGFKEFHAVTEIGAIEDVVKYRDKYIVLPFCESIKAYHEVTMKQDEKFPHIPTRDSCHLSLCNGRLAVLEKDTLIVKIYDLDSSRIDEAKKVDMSDCLNCIDRVCLLPDGRMLVLDSGSESLVLYDYIDKKEIWRYKDLRDIKTICSDEAGFAYAYNHTKKLLHVISPDGMEMNYLYPTKIPKDLDLTEVSKEVMDMSVSGNKMALACGRQGVLVFELQFDD